MLSLICTTGGRNCEPYAEVAANRSEFCDSPLIRPVFSGIWQDVSGYGSDFTVAIYRELYAIHYDHLYEERMKEICQNGVYIWEDSYMSHIWNILTH